MSFHEKSAWVLSIALLVGGVFYVKAVAALSAELGYLAPPNLPLLLVFTFTLIAIAVVGHIVIAATAPGEANAATDERERRIDDRAAHLSGYVLGTGIVLALGLYLFTYDGNVMFYIIFGSLLLSQLAEYAVQIKLHRTSIY